MRHRVVWLLGNWVGVKMSSSLRPSLYSVLSQVLQPTEELAVSTSPTYTYSSPTYLSKVAPLLALFPGCVGGEKALYLLPLSLGTRLLPYIPPSSYLPLCTSPVCPSHVSCTFPCVPLPRILYLPLCAPPTYLVPPPVCLSRALPVCPSHVSCTSPYISLLPTSPTSLFPIPLSH